MITRKWGVFVPPTGAAREVMISVARTMDSMGEQICIMDCAAYQKGIESMMAPDSVDVAYEIWNQSWVCKALEEQWTHILVGALTPVQIRTLKLWKLLNIRLVHWFYEDFRKIDYWKTHAEQYDLFCCVQKDPLNLLIKKPYRFLPTATETVVHSPIIPFEQKRFDISFVGIPTPYRVSILKVLVESGFSIAIAGPFWKQYPELADRVIVDGWISDDQSKELYNQSRMGLNISQDDPSQEREFHQVSPRLYDMAASGTIPLTETLPLGEELFATITAIQFSSGEELIFKAKEKLRDGLEGSVLESNHVQIELFHTYKHRFEQILNWLEEL